jgi:hypothetical protein
MFEVESLNRKEEVVSGQVYGPFSEDTWSKSARSPIKREAGLPAADARVSLLTLDSMRG